MKKILLLVAVAGLGAVIALLIYGALDPVQTSSTQPETIVTSESIPIHQTKFNPARAVTGPDFRQAADVSVNAVVHIQTSFMSKSRVYDDFFGQLWEFFEGRSSNRGQQRLYVGYGSGVIISDDGYIVTNNHVVQGASEIAVTLNDKRKFTATLIGNDPATDLALVKIDAGGLPYLNYGDSDKLEIGEWVLAVGNPFNLTSTVTAGIVSAKARNINILGTSAATDTYIQTDAAVNRGNSGGALVNTSGYLVGINAAIASNTGYYEGYSFAIPVNIVRKVVDDFMQYGEIQKAYIGVVIQEVDEEIAEDNNLDRIHGVYINSLSEDGGAYEAGIEVGDIITFIDGQEINSVSELLEVVGQHSPGDLLQIEVSRKGQKKSFRVELKNERGTTAVIRTGEEFFNNELGVVLKRTTLESGSRDFGLKIVELRDGILYSGGVREGFVILSINGRRVSSQPDIENALQNAGNSTVRLEGIYPNGMRVIYTFDL